MARRKAAVERRMQEQVKGEKEKEERMEKLGHASQEEQAAITISAVHQVPKSGTPQQAVSAHKREEQEWARAKVAAGRSKAEAAKAKAQAQKRISKVLCVVTLCSNCARALTFENILQQEAARKAAREQQQRQWAEADSQRKKEAERRMARRQEQEHRQVHREDERETRERQEQEQEIIQVKGGGGSYWNLLRNGLRGWVCLVVLERMGAWG